jgi:hypothetical protein
MEYTRSNPKREIYYLMLRGIPECNTAIPQYYNTA